MDTEILILRHGPITACPRGTTLVLVEQYLALPEGSLGRSELERRFGAGVITKLCKEYLEEKSTEELLESSTTACPGCNVRVEKSEGCNHVRPLGCNKFDCFVLTSGQMTCWKCGIHFCYRCGEHLNPNNPYVHFNSAKSRCDGKLFDRTDGPMDFQALPFF